MLFRSETAYDRIKLIWQEHDLTVCKDYKVTLLTILKQKGYQVDYLEEDPDKLKELKRYIKELTTKINSDFLDLLKGTEKPDQFRYRQLKNAHAISEEELAEIIIYELKDALKVSEITEHDIRYWLENRERRELGFELLKTSEEQLVAHREWERKNVESLTRRKHLIHKSKILHDMFKILGIDKNTGEGVFTQKSCSEFIKYIQNGKRDEYNALKIGPHLYAKGPKCPTKFVKRILEKLGLKTNSGLYGAKRLSGHEIDRESWARMQKYYENRCRAKVSIADLPHNASCQNSEEQAETFHESFASTSPPDE